jgi:hypothetical protein
VDREPAGRPGNAALESGAYTYESRFEAGDENETNFVERFGSEPAEEAGRAVRAGCRQRRHPRSA